MRSEPMVETQGRNRPGFEICLEVTTWIRNRESCWVGEEHVPRPWGRRWYSKKDRIKGSLWDWSVLKGKKGLSCDQEISGLYESAVLILRAMASHWRLLCREAFAFYRIWLFIWENKYRLLYFLFYSYFLSMFMVYEGMWTKKSVEGQRFVISLSGQESYSQIPTLSAPQ